MDDYHVCKLEGNSVAKGRGKGTENCLMNLTFYFKKYFKRGKHLNLPISQTRSLITSHYRRGRKK